MEYYISRILRVERKQWRYKFRHSLDNYDAELIGYGITERIIFKLQRRRPIILENVRGNIEKIFEVCNHA